jgi:hypothetical protein
MRTDKSWRDLPFDEVKYDDNGEWGWGNGGYPPNDLETSISSYDAEGNEVRYKMPQCINIMLRRMYECGTQDTQERIKRALGIE